jgi:hypothetical protein
MIAPQMMISAVFLFCFRYSFAFDNAQFLLTFAISKALAIRSSFILRMELKSVACARRMLITVSRFLSAVSIVFFVADNSFAADRPNSFSRISALRPFLLTLILSVFDV